MPLLGAEPEAWRRKGRYDGDINNVLVQCFSPFSWRTVYGGQGTEKKAKGQRGMRRGLESDTVPEARLTSSREHCFPKGRRKPHKSSV
ncbi:hypothetical protein HPP92_019909 [Vanilla planifolia]|uniref:Uncharacterized protein n=1 Tax=Vanilla planifolia TaxID=51239 RepID=A0A835UKA0_VANPL|nr:hypothetical protein HPP92_019909 [Vanilla planifolia]